MTRSSHDSRSRQMGQQCLVSFLPCLLSVALLYGQLVKRLIFSEQAGTMRAFYSAPGASWLPGGFAFAHELGSNGSLSKPASFPPVLKRTQRLLQDARHPGGWCPTKSWVSATPLQGPLRFSHQDFRDLGTEGRLSATSAGGSERQDPRALSVGHSTLSHELPGHPRTQRLFLLYCELCTRSLEITESRMALR